MAVASRARQPRVWPPRVLGIHRGGRHAPFSHFSKALSGRPKEWLPRALAVPRVGGQCSSHPALWAAITVAAQSGRPKEWPPRVWGAQGWVTNALATQPVGRPMVWPPRPLGGQDPCLLASLARGCVVPHFGVSGCPREGCPCGMHFCVVLCVLLILG